MTNFQDYHLPTSNKGHEYLMGPDKRKLDLFIANLALPLNHLIVRMLSKSIPPILGSTFNAQRFGGLQNSVNIPKLTLPASVYASNCFGDNTASFLIRTGLNELPQMQLVKSGLMSAVGARPLDYQDVLDTADNLDPKTRGSWLKGRELYKLGILSEVGLQSHKLDQNQQQSTLSPSELAHARADSELKYFKDASLKLDLSIIARTIALPVSSLV
jgi:hypothetical protein